MNHSKQIDASEQWFRDVLRALQLSPHGNAFVFDVLRNIYEFVPQGGLLGAIRATYGLYDTPGSAALAVMNLYEDGELAL